MARNDHSGYPLKWFKDQNATRNAYECAICLEVLKDPVQVRDCGHQFCALCIDDILKIDPHCPTCRIKISDVMIFEDHAARRLIKQLVVNCCNEGCSWQGCLSSLLQVHQNNCNFSIHRGDDLDKKVEQLVQTLETQLMLKISTLEKKYEQDIKELKLKLQRSENRLQLLEEKEKVLCEKEKKTAAKEGYERLEIPRVYHPFIQGRNQETIQKIAMETNTKIYIPPPSVPKDEITISGDKEGVALAKDKILRIYKEKERHVTTVIEEKKSQHKYVTGPKGHALQEIFASTGTSGEMPHLDSDTEAITLRGEPNRLGTGLTQAYERANRRANTEGISLAPSFGQLGRGISAGLSNSSQKQDQPMGNIYSALSGADMPPSQTYDARRSLSACASTGNGRSGSTTPLSNSTAQTESSTIQCKSRPYNTHLQVSQSSPTLQEMTEKLKMVMDSQKEAQKEPEVVLLRADREATTENRASEIKEISDRVPENIENMVERKTGNENTVDPEPVEQIKSDNMDSGLDNSPNRVVDTKSLDSYVAHAVNSEKIEKKVEWLTDTKKSSEPPKKKSSKQRIKDINKKETGGNLMDAYTYKPPLQERVVENRVKPVELFPEQSDKPLEEDLSWEDERENIADENKMEKENDTEPAAPVKQTRRKYERDFLLQLQYMPLCTTKPAGLPDIEVVLDAPVQQGKQPPKKLYRKVMAILDKLTPQTFKTSVEQIMALNIDTPERLEVVVDRIFEKAISEPASSVIHANMCRCLFGITVADAEGKDVSFRELLLNRCQKEFEKEKEDKVALLGKHINQLKGLSGEERKDKREGTDEALAKNKERMLGNIKFIGELFKLKLLTENIMHDCIFQLFRAGDEESLESMCMLLFTIGKDLDSDKAKPRIQQYFDQINRIIAAKKVSSRVIFMLRDVIELRQNKWVPRREEQYNPPITEMKKMREQRLTTQQQVKDNKQKKGGPGGQDSSKSISNDDVITNSKGEKSVPTEQQLRNKTSYPVQAVMMSGQRQGAYIGHPMTMQPRSMRPARAIYSSSPPGHSPMQGYIQQQNMQYQVVGQDPYSQPVMRPTFIPNVQPANQMQPTTAPFQPQYHPQQHQYYNQGKSPMYYAVQPNQPIQPQQSTQSSNPTIQTNNLTKPKPKRTSKIRIRDPKDNKDVTERILSHTYTANGRSGSTPPLTKSTAQTESSTIQAQFAVQVAARVGSEKGKQDNEN